MADLHRWERAVAGGSIGRPYFEEIAKAVSGPSKADRARVKEIMLRHGLVPA
jgi:hypothetical protein